MPFQVSPGVNVSEIDLTTIIPQVSTTSAGIVISTDWGPAGIRTLISNENQLREKFGTPSNDNFASWFSAANFLQYGNNLQVVRAVNGSALNANCGVLGLCGDGVLIENREVFEGGSGSTSGAMITGGVFAAKYPGDLGNGIGISIFDSAHRLAGNSGRGISFDNWGSSNIDGTNGKTGDFAGYFDEKPGSSILGGEKTGNSSDLYDEMHIVVFDRDGRWTGTRYKPLEIWPNVSKAADATLSDGRSNYYRDVLNNRSNYVWSLNVHPNAGGGAENWGLDYKDIGKGASFGSCTRVTDGLVYGGAGQLEGPSYMGFFGNGGSGGALTDGPAIEGYRKFKDSESVDINLLLLGDNNTTVANELVDIAEFRKDCVAFLSPEKADTVGNPGNEATDVVGFRDAITTKSTYAVCDSGWKYMYDVYNDVYRYVPLNPDTAGCCVRTDAVADPWYSPAGFTRGTIRNIIKLAWNPNKAERDTLYKKGINPVCSFEGEGIVLFGDKTMTAKPSAFDRINVRRLFIVLEKAIATASKFSLFEFNDAFTRSQFKNLVEPFLRDVQSRRGIFDFKVVCDTSNNTAEIIDRNEFVADIYIKPARSINFIQLNFIATRTGVDFDEIGG